MFSIVYSRNYSTLCSIGLSSNVWEFGRKGVLQILGKLSQPPWYFCIFFLLSQTATLQWIDRVNWIQEVCSFSCVFLKPSKYWNLFFNWTIKDILVYQWVFFFIQVWTIKYVLIGLGFQDERKIIIVNNIAQIKKPKIIIIDSRTLRVSPSPASWLLS